MAPSEHESEQEEATPPAAGSESGAECFPPRFASWAELDAFVRELRAASFQLFYVRMSSPVATRNAALRQRKWPPLEAELIPPSFRFYRRLYCCTHAARDARKSDGAPPPPQRARTAVRATGCVARLTAIVQFDAAARCHYVSVTASGRHNHPCDRAQFHAYPESRRITEPSILRRVQALVARGLNASAIRDKIAKFVTESRGAECIPTRKDVYNLIMKLKKEAGATAPRSAAAAAAAVADGNDDNSAEDDDDGLSEPEDEDEMSANDSGEDRENDANAARRAGKKRRAAEAGGLSFSESEDEAVLARLRQRKRRGISLARLQALLDSPYSYHQARADIGQVLSARAEHVPQTITSFRHSIERVALSDERVQDVDFVLPRYVLHGCEAGIAAFCGQHAVPPAQVGVTLLVFRDTSSEAPRVVTIASHQLRTMKGFYNARDVAQEATKAIKWLAARPAIRSCPPPPFDDYFHTPKDAVVHPVRYMPLTRIVVRGRHFLPSNKTIEFTDSVYGANVLKFASNAEIDLECAKAATLSLHARYHASVSFVCPAFNFESNLEARNERARAYGAFEAPRDRVAGVVQLVSRRWGSFVLTLSRQLCVVFAPTEGDRAELQETLDALLRGIVADVGFEFAARPSAAARDTDSGVLALLFVELSLEQKSWVDLSALVDAQLVSQSSASLAYFRARSLLHAVQVVSKQDVHGIQWL
ncbi:hypothetical protein PybrP1_009526 [[Pythium] brassicae (nom. inval.)]|nr:hypothetical protein PybrP1_009526 [[Pythium] brassicae (nom. inval.)]